MSNDPDLPPFFPMVEDGSQMISNFANHSRRAHAALLSTTIGPSQPPLPLTEAAALSSLLLQTVVLSDARTNEGRIIEAVALPWFDIISFLKNDPNVAFQIPWDK